MIEFNNAKLKNFIREVLYDDLEFRIIDVGEDNPDYNWNKKIDDAKTLKELKVALKYILKDVREILEERDSEMRW